MITILHGENIQASRKRLIDLIDQAKSEQINIKKIDGQALKTATAELLSGESTLFGGETLIIIEELHSLPISKRRDALVDQIARIPASENIILWEKKKLTAIMIKKFTPKSEFGSQMHQIQAEVFEPSKVLWKFIASISGNSAQKTTQLALYQEAIQNDDPFYIQNLLTRQIRLLIQASTGPAPRLAPFQVSGLNSQLKTFTLNQLLAAHQALLEIDYRQKSGNSSFNMEQELFLWLENL